MANIILPVSKKIGSFRTVLSIKYGNFSYEFNNTKKASLFVPIDSYAFRLMSFKCILNNYDDKIVSLYATLKECDFENFVLDKNLMLYYTNMGNKIFDKDLNIYAINNTPRSDNIAVILNDNTDGFFVLIEGKSDFNNIDLEIVYEQLEGKW